MLSRFSLTFFVSDNLCVFLVGDMGRFADAALRKRKRVRSKKDTLEEKKKLGAKSKTPSPDHAALPEHEVVVAEPAAPKKSRVLRKKDAQKEKGIVIKEPTPEVRDSPLVASGDKGKGISEQSSPPAKMQKTTEVSEPRQASLVPEVVANPGISINHCLSLDKMTGPSESTLAVQAVESMVRSLNLLGGDFWGRLQSDNINSVLELGLHTSVVVRISHYHVFSSYLCALT